MNSTATVQNSNFCPPKSTYAGRRKKKKKNKNKENTAPNVDADKRAIQTASCFLHKIHNLIKVKCYTINSLHVKQYHIIT